MGPEESVLYKEPLRVQVVNNRVCIPIMARREYRNLVLLVNSLQTLFNIGPHSEPGFYFLLSRGAQLYMDLRLKHGALAVLFLVIFFPFAMN